MHVGSKNDQMFLYKNVKYNELSFFRTVKKCLMAHAKSSIWLFQKTILLDMKYSIWTKYFWSLNFILCTFEFKHDLINIFV